MLLSDLTLENVWGDTETEKELCLLLLEYAYKEGDNIPQDKYIEEAKCLSLWNKDSNNFDIQDYLRRRLGDIPRLSYLASEVVSILQPLYRARKWVEEISVDTMEGDTSLIRELNALLTKECITTRNVPSDECLSEAKYIQALGDNNSISSLCSYIAERFGRTPETHMKAVAEKILEVLKKYRSSAM